MKSWLPKFKLSIADAVSIFICSIPAFYLLGVPAIYIWDEAVYANASLDMSEGASWIVPSEPEYNTKPPLVLWLQAISLLIFSQPEWAIRLPSALAVTGILIIMTVALRRWGFSQWARILSMVAFVGHEGFIRHHISRTGDLDAVMTFFMMGYVFVVLDALHFKRWNDRHLVAFFFLLVAAFYAKSVAGLLMLAPLSLIVMLSPVRSALHSVKFWFGVFLAAVICLTYYVVREAQQPGFADISWNSDYMRMFDNIMPWHEHPANYYFKNFILLKTFTPWIFFLLAAILYDLIFIKDRILQNHLLRWIILSLGYLLLISIPAVKLEWYDAPVYPLFAMVLGVTADYLTRNFSGNLKLLWIIPIGFILWRKIDFIRTDLNPRHPLEHEGSILRDTKVTPQTKVYMPVETHEHRLQLDFYRKIMLHNTGIEIPVLDSLNEIQPGDHIIVRNENFQKINESFDLEVVKEWEDMGFELQIKQEFPLPGPQK